MPGALLAVALLVALGPGAPVAAAPPGGAEGTVAFAFDPAAPVKGRDAAVTIRLDVRDATGAPLVLGVPPALRASAGTLGPLQPGGGPGRYETRWEPSPAPQPEVTGFLAVVPRCPSCAEPLAIGGARLAVAAAIELPGRTDPGVSTTVEIGGRSWGPVRADGEGRFRLPAVVPPGTRWGLATSRSDLGNEKRTKLDLHIDDRPGLLCAAFPERLPADGVAEAGLACVGWTAEGKALDTASFRATAERGGVAAGTDGGGLWRARFRAPAGGAGPCRLTVASGPPRAASAALSLELHPGPPAAIEWEIEGEPALPGSTVPVRARVVDAWGSLVGAATAEDGEIVDGRLRIRAGYGDGRQRVVLRWAPPPPSAGEAPPAALTRVVHVALRPEGTVDVVAAREGGLLRWRFLGPDGAALRGRKVTLAAEGVELGPVEPDGDGGRCAIRRGGGTVTVTDDASGATALLEVP